MTKDKQHKQLKPWFIPILVTIALLLLLFAQNLQEEKALPSDGWSRSISLPLTTANAKPFWVKTTDGYHIYATTGEHINHVVINNRLKVSKQSTIPIKIPTLEPFWIDRQNVIYIKEGKLVHINGEKEKVLAPDVDGMIANQDLILYWQGKQLFSVDRNDFSIVPVGQTQYKIESIILNEDSSFITIENINANDLQLELFNPSKQKKGYEIISLFSLSEYAGESIADIQYVYNQQENKLHFIYSISSTKQGVTTYRAFYTTMLLDAIAEKPQFEQVKIKEELSQIPIENPQYLNLSLKENQPVLLFSAEGLIAPKKSAVNIYEAKYENKQWLTNKRSTTSELSVQPFWIDDGLILWLDYLTKNKYELMGTTTDPTILQESQKLNTNDWINALSDSLLAFAVSLLVIFNGMLWVVPPTIFLVVLLFYNFNLVEKGVSWVKLTSILLYLGTQLLFIQKIFNSSFYTYAPNYLTFTGSSFIIPLLLALFTWFAVKIGKNKEWSGLQEISYYIGINLWLIIILLGPYII
ncbi:hypothetical protein [Tepidibacillus sp. HK-1]|uniref:hypothetical protein n=1 Tax=Tepidibacillus sp. HK-1 TaxID=1883407 RepID=UPI000852CC74|nr:hypothetical protein [Tepidibacillus sp. HK-1]GBF10344.1 hypothetical protein HK1_00356 [Tepidibacillus sp. HK-1]